jgi:hypothetical protein
MGVRHLLRFGAAAAVVLVAGCSGGSKVSVRAGTGTTNTSVPGAGSQTGPGSTLTTISITGGPATTTPNSGSAPLTTAPVSSPVTTAPSGISSPVTTTPIAGSGPPTTTPASAPATTTPISGPATTVVTRTTPTTGETSIVVQVTAADSGQTFDLRVGQSVELTLATAGQQWNGVNVTPPGILAGDPTPSPPPHGQLLIWTAVKTGTVTISATGTALCAAGQACPMYARLFSVTIVVS